MSNNFEALSLIVQNTIHIHDNLVKVLLAIAWHLPNSFPSHKRISEITGKCDRTVRRQIKELVKLNILFLENRNGKTSVYKIKHPSVWKSATPDIMDVLPTPDIMDVLPTPDTMVSYPTEAKCPTHLGHLGVRGGRTSRCPTNKQINKQINKQGNFEKIFEPDEESKKLALEMQVSLKNFSLKGF